jgi:hypothetical protein
MPQPSTGRLPPANNGGCRQVSRRAAGKQSPVACCEDKDVPASRGTSSSRPLLSVSSNAALIGEREMEIAALGVGGPLLGWHHRSL